AQGPDPRREPAAAHVDIGGRIGREPPVRLAGPALPRAGAANRPGRTDPVARTGRRLGPRSEGRLEWRRAAPVARRGDGGRPDSRPGSPGAGQPVAAAERASRDLRRAAARLWIAPLDAARSSSRVARRSSLLISSPSADWTRLAEVFSEDLIAL